LRHGCPQRVPRFLAGSLCALRFGMLEQAETLRERCRAFAVRVLTFVRALPQDVACEALARQLARSGTGASANYHSACRSRSRAEFVSRMAVALDEVDESCAWLAVIREGRIATGSELDWLEGEARELRAIFARSVTTARRNTQAHPSSSRQRRRDQT